MSTTITSSLGSVITTSYAWTGAAGLSASTRNRAGVVTRNESVNPYAASTAWAANSSVVPSTRVTLPSSPPGTNITTGSMGQNPTSGSDLFSVYNIDGLGPSAGTPMRASGAWFLVSGTGYMARVGGTGDFTPLTANVWTWVRAAAAQSGIPAGVAAVRRTDGSSPPAGDRAWATGSNTALDGPAPVNYFDGNTASSSETVGDTTSPLLMDGFETSRRSQSIFHDVIGGGQDVTLRPAALRSGTLRLLYADEATATQAMAMLTRPALFFVADPDRPAVTMYFAVDGDVSLKLHDFRTLWLVDVGYREVTP